MPGHDHAHAARRVLGVYFTVRPLRQIGTFLASLLELIQPQMNNSRRACLFSANHFELRCTAFKHTAPLADDMSP